MYAFQYHRPQSVADAARLLASNSEAKLLAGGHTLLPTMKMRLAAPKAIVDLSRVAELKGIAKSGNNLVIGAMATHAEVASFDVLRSAIRGLADVAGAVGGPPARHRGPLPGAAGHNHPPPPHPPPPPRHR